MKNSILIIAIAALVGCASTEQIGGDINTLWQHQHVDTFFQQYGPPATQYKMAGDGTIFTWQSNVLGYTMPSHTTFNANVSSYGTVTGNAFETGGGSITVFCKLQLTASDDGLIKQVKIQRDTMGKWRLSRCSEIFLKDAAAK